MPKSKTVFLSENDGTVLPEDGDTRMLTLDGEYEIPTSMEELLQECGLTFKDYYSENYE